MPRPAEFELTMGELRAVAAFNVACAERVIEVFEAERRDDLRPRRALGAASAFVVGGGRTKAQRVAALAAHRAAKEVSGAAAHAAMAAGDAAASAYLHPLAEPTQVGHILRGPAHSVLAHEGHRDPVPSRRDLVRSVLDLATPAVVEVLLRYPAAPGGRTAVAAVMVELDVALRVKGR